MKFQTRPDSGMPLRMLNYWLRLYDRHPQKTIHQVVVYLCKTNSPLVYQDTFQAQQTTHQFRVVRLWEQPKEQFLTSLGLLPLAIMSDTDDPETALQQVARRIETIPDNKLKSDLLMHTFVIAGLRLEDKIVTSILRREIMQESSTYQLLRREAIQEGLSLGIQQGLAQGAKQQQLETARKMLARGFDQQVVAEITGLSLEEVADLT